MMNFNLGSVAGASEAPKMLAAGIHNATFQGVKRVTREFSGKEKDVMEVSFDVEGYGSWSNTFFAPESSERSEGQYGPNPSQLDHFLVAVKQILEALNPELGKAWDRGTPPIEGNTFTSLVSSIKKVTEPYIGKSVQIKVIPNNKGYAQMPQYPARIATSREGTIIGVKYATLIIAAKDLTLLPKEVTKIEAAKNAKPTNMSAPVKNDLLSGMSDLLDEGDKDDESDLPF